MLAARLRPYRRMIAVVAVGLLGIWLLFLDSYSLYNRITWQRTSNRLRAENTYLQEQIRILEAKNAAELSDEDVEKIAREQYGMRLPGEMVYRLQENP